MADVHTPSDFRAWIADLIASDFRTQDALARAVGMTSSPFGGQVRAKGTLGAETLLRLAIATGRDPLWVLRLGKKEALADLLESLFVGGRKRIGAHEQALLETWESLHEDQRKVIRDMLALFVRQNAAGPPAATAPRRRARARAASR